MVTFTEKVLLLIILFLVVMLAGYSFLYHQQSLLVREQRVVLVEKLEELLEEKGKVKAYKELLEIEMVRATAEIMRKISEQNQKEVEETLSISKGDEDD